MPNYQRAYTQGGTYFFTVVTEGRQPLLTNDNVRRALRQSITLVRQTLPFRIDGWVLLPDHLHAIWTLPPHDSDFSNRWRLIKRHVTHACGSVHARGPLLSRRRASKGQGTLWQNRFWEHRIRDEHDFRRHLDYLHINPLKHGLVERVADWPWSTFHRWVQAGVYPRDWAGAEGDEPVVAGE